MVAAVASDEPQIAPNAAHAPTDAMATPPRQWLLNHNENWAIFGVDHTEN